MDEIIDNALLAEISSKNHLRNLMVKSFKNDTIVYKADYLKRPVILKIHENKLNFNREIVSLRNLRGKNARFPNLLYCENIMMGKKEIGYLIEECLTGSQLSELFYKYSLKEKERILYNVGEALGMLNYAIPQKDLLECGLWKYAYEGVND